VLPIIFFSVSLFRVVFIRVWEHRALKLQEAAGRHAIGSAFFAQAHPMWQLAVPFFMLTATVYCQYRHGTVSELTKARE
jgi:hypothetical protein